MISHSPEVSNPTGYFLDSTGSSVTNRWFFPDIDPCICECHVWRDHWNWETIWECMETPQVRLNQRGLIDPSLAHDCTRMFRRLFQFSLNFCFSTDEFESNPRFHAYKLVQDHWLGKIVGFFFDVKFSTSLVIKLPHVKVVMCHLWLITLYNWILWWDLGSCIDFVSKRH